MSLRPLRLLTVTALMLIWVHAFGNEVRVDLDVDHARKAALKPGWENWEWKEGNSGSMRLGDVTVTLRASSGSVLEGVFNKRLLNRDSPLAADGIAVRAATNSANGGVEMILQGLAPGRHSVATYHNEVDKGDPTEFSVRVGDSVPVERVVPTRQATNDADMASAYVVFEAKAGEPVMLQFVPRTPASGQGIVINGFEVDRVNPKLKATQPSPADREEHTPDETSLSWTAPADAVTHSLYFGTDPRAVAEATSSSSEFKGNLSLASYASLGRLDPMQDYFWRVDEVDASKHVTRGDLWRFSVRRLAFPSAEGYGRFARGGRGGRVIHVTNLNDSGPGSFRAAVEAEGPRTVVFDVSGLITLESRLIIRNPYLTVAGQTAPGKGICVRKYNLGMLGAHDVILRYLRVRPGNISGTTLDGMGMASSDQCIIDHCSISWTIDESFSSRGAKNITLQRTLISEALNDAGHKNYPPGTQHGYAASIGGNIGSFHHNLLADCAGRNWSLAGGLDNRGEYAGRLDIRNNVVYNWKHRATDGGAHEVNFVANYYKPGPSTRFFYALNAQYGGFPGTQQYYFEGNVMPGHFGVTNQVAGRIATTERGGRVPTDYSPWVDTPFFDPFVKTETARQAYTNVLSNVGCNFPVLDDHDARVIGEVRKDTCKYRGSKTGLPGLPDTQEDVGGWEDYPEVHRPANWDTDRDGMPDQWEESHGLNPEDPTDGTQDRDGDGYTNLEEYLGSLVGEF